MYEACKNKMALGYLGRIKVIELFMALTRRSYNRPKEKPNALKASFGREQIKPQFLSTRPTMRAVDDRMVVDPRPSTETEIAHLLQELGEACIPCMTDVCCPSWTPEIDRRLDEWSEEMLMADTDLDVFLPFELQQADNSALEPTLAMEEEDEEEQARQVDVQRLASTMATLDIT